MQKYRTGWCVGENSKLVDWILAGCFAASLGFLVENRGSGLNKESEPKSKEHCRERQPGKLDSGIEGPSWERREGERMDGWTVLESGSRGKSV